MEGDGIIECGEEAKVSRLRGRSIEFIPLLSKMEKLVLSGDLTHEQLEQVRENFSRNEIFLELDEFDVLYLASFWNFCRCMIFINYCKCFLTLLILESKPAMGFIKI